MKTLFQFIITFLISFSIYAQTAVFKNFDFNSEEYTIIGIRTESDRNSLADSIGDFYTDKIEILNQFKDSWVFEKPGKKFACGYHYKISVCKNGKEVKSVRVNLNCNEVVSEEGYFFFDSNLLRTFYGKLNKPKIIDKSFENNTIGNEYIDSIVSKKKLILVPELNWRKYEGQFSINYHIKESNQELQKDDEKLILSLSKSVSAKYPDENFNLYIVGWNGNKREIEVKSNRSLYDKFDSHPFGWRKWKKFDVKLRTYWKE